MAKIKIELDGKTLREAKRVADDLGLDLQSATRAFYRQIAREGRIPLDLALRTGESASVPAPSAVAAPAHSEPADKPSEQPAAPKKAPASEPAPAHAAQKPAACPAAAAAPKSPVQPQKSDAHIPSMNEIPSQDELLERMLEAKEEAEMEARAEEAVKRDNERKRARVEAFEKAADEAAKQRAQKAVPEQQTAQGTTAADQLTPAELAELTASELAALRRKPATGVAPASKPEPEADALAAAESAASKAVPAKTSSASETKPAAASAADAAQRPRFPFAGVPETEEEAAAKEQLRRQDQRWHDEGWRGSWLFDGDDPDDELLFGPYEI